MTRKPGYVAAGITGLVLSAGVGIPLALLSGLGDSEPNRPSPAASGDGWDGAWIVCEEDGSTRVLTPVVRPRPDGVHIFVENRSGAALRFEVWEEGGGGGAGVEPGRAEVPGPSSRAWQLAPGDVPVRCVDERVEDPDGHPPRDGVGFRVIDEGDLWVPTMPECEGTGLASEILDYPSDAEGRGDDPIEVARVFLRGRVQSGDELRLTGYPEAPDTMVAASRDGRTFATASLWEADSGGWLVKELNTCAGGVPHSTPSVAEIVCEQDGTTSVLTPTVQPQRDGVHLQVDNRTGREMELAAQGETQSHAASEYAPPGTTSLVSSIAPGRVGVVCVDWNDQPEPGPSADLTIVDPEGLWASSELDCGAPVGGGENLIMEVIHDHSFASPGERGDPIELARSHFGWADSGDIVEPAGYPEADTEANGALIRVVRGGRVVAVAGYAADGQGGWLLGSERLCGGSDTAPAAWNPAGP